MAGRPETVEAARANPEAFARKTLKQVADHTAQVIETGGLLTYMIADRGLSAASVALSEGHDTIALDERLQPRTWSTS